MYEQLLHVCVAAEKSVISVRNSIILRGRLDHEE